MRGKISPISKFELWTEIITWSVIILVLVFLNFLPNKPINNDSILILLLATVFFILLYYFLIIKLFNTQTRIWIKSILEIILISVIIITSKEFGVYSFALYFLPIAGATLLMGAIDSMIVALVISVFIIVGTFLNADEFLPTSSQMIYGLFQIGFILLVANFCRFLALQIQNEKKARLEAELIAKAYRDTEKREHDFMLMTSHELLTPLSIIRGFSSLLYKDEKKRLTKKQFDYVIQIHENTKKMINLTSEILSISQINSHEMKFKFEYFPIDKLVDYVIKQLNHILKENKSKIIVNKPSQNLPKLKIDHYRLEQAIFNILENAIKYSYKNTICINYKITNNELIITITDSGRGISPHDRDKLFNPFMRGKNVLDIDGTGLGLYVSKIIIEKHKGHIWFDSEIDKGTIFNISLPLK